MSVLQQEAFPLKLGGQCIPRVWLTSVKSGVGRIEPHYITKAFSTKDTMQGKLENSRNSFQLTSWGRPWVLLMTDCFWIIHFSSRMWKDQSKRKKSKDCSICLTETHQEYFYNKPLFLGWVFKNGPFRLGGKISFTECLQLYEPVLLLQFFVPSSYSSGLILFTFYLVDVTIMILANTFLYCSNFLTRSMYYFYHFFLKGQQMLSGQWDYRIILILFFI